MELYLNIGCKFYPNLVELNQTAKEINFIKVMNELDGITFGKPESWVFGSRCMETMVSSV